MAEGREVASSDGKAGTLGSALRRAALVAGPAVLALGALLPRPESLTPDAWRLLGVTLWMVIWWLSEAVPLAATALVPIAALPLLQVQPIGAVTAHYGNPLIFLFLGGFLLAAALQRWGLHRRIALLILARIGHTPRGVIWGFALATAFLSLWISNTATTVMMLAVAASVVDCIESRTPDAATARRFGKALMLTVAYSASIGGVGTLIGTPPNALLASLLAETRGIEIGFFRWMLFGLPIVAVMLPTMHLLLTRVLFDLSGLDLAPVRALLQGEFRALGPMSRAERRVATVFALAAASWIFREALALPVTDSGIAILAALTLFALPAGTGEGRLLDWSVAPELPWGVLLLFGGGLALAGAFEATGLARAVALHAGRLGSLPLWALLLVLTAALVFLSEITSNTATAATLLPVMAAVAAGLGASVEWLTLPVALGASLAFMLPTGTPPNAIVFAYRGLTLTDMARAGFWLNLISIAVITAAVLWLAPLVFDMAPPDHFGGIE